MTGRLGFAERILVVSCLVVSVRMNWQIGQQLQLFASPVGPSYLEPGVAAPPLEVQTLEGGHTSVDFGGAAEHTVLYFLSPTCHVCAKNAKNIEALASEDPTRVRVIGLASVKEQDELRRALASEKPSYPIYLLSETTRTAYHLRTYPTTLVVDKAGVVQRAWPGAYVPGRRQSEVEEFFTLRLPGLVDLAR